MYVRVVNDDYPKPRAPEGGRVYGIRTVIETDRPGTIENSVTVDRWGYLVVDEPLQALDGPSDPYIKIPKRMVKAFEQDDRDLIAQFLKTAKSTVYP